MSETSEDITRRFIEALDNLTPEQDAVLAENWRKAYPAAAANKAEA